MKKVLALIKLMQTPFQGKKYILCAGLLLTFSIFFLSEYNPDFVYFQELKIYDLLLERNKGELKTNLVTLVDIDEKSLNKYGQWPWPRYRMAKILEILTQNGAAGIGTDILFSEKDRTSPALLKKNMLSELGVKVEFKGLPGNLEDYDKLMAQVLRGGPFTLGFYAFGFKAVSEKQMITRLSIQDDSQNFLPTLNYSSFGPKGASSPLEYIPKATGIIPPLPEFAKAVKSTGHTNALGDVDNIVRRMPLLIAYSSAKKQRTPYGLNQPSVQGKPDWHIYPSLSLGTVLQTVGAKNITLRMNHSGLEEIIFHSPVLGRVNIPVDPQGNLLLKFRGAKRIFPYISVSNILNGQFKEEDIAGKIILIGSSATSLNDIISTPLDRYYPGMETHATAADMILSGDYIFQPTYLEGVVKVSIISIGLLSTLLFTWLRALPLLIPTLIILGGLVLGADLSMQKNVYISPFYPALTLAANFIVITFLKFWTEERKRHFIHSAFSHYLEPSIVDKIAESKTPITLTGEEKNVSVFFSDIRGFSEISEQLSPSEVTEFLCAYLTPMTKVIKKNEGTLDKFIGDSIMAFWNAPTDIDKHPDKAVRSAINSLDTLAELNNDLQKQYGITLNIGIGLHYGTVRVGNFGSEDLFDYTIIGDNVNLCSRIESLTKFYERNILVSGEMRAQCTEDFHFLSVDLVQVKGKKIPVELFSVLTEDELIKLKNVIPLIEEGISFFREKLFHEAKNSFFQAEHSVSLRLSQIYLERIEEALKYSSSKHLNIHPDKDFSGVFIHKSK